MSHNVLTRVAKFLLPFLILSQLLGMKPVLAQDAVTEEPAVSAASVEGVEVMDPQLGATNDFFRIQNGTTPYPEETVSAAEVEGACSPFFTFVSWTDYVSATQPGKLTVKVSNCASGSGSFRVWYTGDAIPLHQAPDVLLNVSDFKKMAGKKVTFDAPEWASRAFVHVWGPPPSYAQMAFSIFTLPSAAPKPPVNVSPDKAFEVVQSWTWPRGLVLLAHPVVGNPTYKVVVQMTGLGGPTVWVGKTETIIVDLSKDAGTFFTFWPPWQLGVSAYDITWYNPYDPIPVGHIFTGAIDPDRMKSTWIASVKVPRKATAVSAAEAGD